jgi:hypothetical protein
MADAHYSAYIRWCRVIAQRGRGPHVRLSRLVAARHRSPSSWRTVPVSYMLCVRVAL